MRGYHHVLIALAVAAFAAPGCKVTTCDSSDPDCVPSSSFGGFGSNSGGDGGSTSSNDQDGGQMPQGGTSGAGGETASGGQAEGGSGGSMMTNMPGIDECAPDDPDLDACNRCIQSVCCTEIQACSSTVECSGAYSDTDGGVATSESEIACVRDTNEFLADPNNANPDDPDDPVLGFAGELTVESAEMICAEDTESGDLSQATTDLVECILHRMDMPGDAGMMAEFGDCAEACFGIIE